MLQSTIIPPRSAIHIFVLLLLSSFLWLASCRNTKSTSNPPAASGQIVLDGCLGLSGVAEKCTLVTNASACTGSKCSHMVVIFSGGEMGCVSGSGYNNALTSYASRGYAAVCINYFDTPTGSGDVPYIDEASRIDFAVKEATSGEWAKAYWSGEYLLFEGISPPPGY